MATLTLRPNADGSVSWTKNSGATNYSCVDEAVADDATTEVHAGSAAVADTYELPDHSTEAGIINSVKLYIKGKTIDSSPALGGFFKCGITYSASTYTCGINHYTTLWTTYNYTWNLSPKTGVGWTWAEIDALTIYLYGGYVAEWDGKSWYYSIPYVTQCYIEVDYDPPELLNIPVASFSMTAPVPTVQVLAAGTVTAVFHLIPAASFSMGTSSGFFHTEDGDVIHNIPAASFSMSAYTLRSMKVGVDHLIYEANYTTVSRRVNRVYVIGMNRNDDTIYDEYINDTLVSEYGEILRIGVESFLTSVDGIAEIIYNKLRFEDDRGFITIPPHVGLEMYDVFDVSDATCSQTDAEFRTIGYSFIYDSGVQKGHKHTYEQTIRMASI